MPEPILVAKAKSEINLLPQMVNRHGLIVGANGIVRGVLGSLLGGGRRR